MADIVELPEMAQRADYERLYGTLIGRRSIRRFRDSPVEADLIQKILEAASTAPMGLPPTEVGVLVFDGKDKVRAFRDEAMKVVEKQKWFTTKLGSSMLRPFMPKEAVQMMRDFVGPVFEVYERTARDGGDWFMYDAPLGMMFYAPHVADPADPMIAATYAMLAAESLGLGSIMLGFPGLLLKSSKALRRNYGIEHGVQSALFVAFGHPAVRYRRGVKRRFASVRYV
jgi:nitroreductase